MSPAMNPTPTLQEFAISLNFTGTILPLSIDSLTAEGIILQDWTVSHLSLPTDPIKQIRFSNGISIVSRPNLLTFIEPIKVNSSEMVRLPKIVSRYINVTPEAAYVNIIFDTNIFVGFAPDNPKSAYEYIKNLLSTQQHRDIVGELEKVNIQLAYKMGNTKAHFKH